MIRINTHLGAITLSEGYLSNLIGHTVTGCFGVVKMNPAGASQGIIERHAVFLVAVDNGVKVRVEKGSGKLAIDLHLTVMYGINVAAITDSIVNKVRFTVEQETGLAAEQVNVFVDGMENG